LVVNLLYDVAHLFEILNEHNRTRFV